MATWGYGLLGPVEVRVDDRAVELPGASQRLVLAMLLLEANRRSPPYRLIDELWGEALPADPPAALRTQVSRLRRALGPAGGRLVTAGRRVPAERSARPARFGQVRGRAGRGGQAGGEPGPAILDEALGLWRGPVLAEFADRPFALADGWPAGRTPVAARERRAGLLLSLGLVEEAVAGLQAIVAEHAGTGADAGAAHAGPLPGRPPYRGPSHLPVLAPAPGQRTRTGSLTRPGTIEQDILRHAAPTPDTPGGATTRARPLPLPVTSFVGRDEDLAAMTDLLGRSAADHLARTGRRGQDPAGARSGRTSGRLLPGRSLLLRPSRGDRVAAVTRTLATAAGITERAFERLDDQVVEQLAGRHLLLVLDNCEHVAQAVAVIAERLLRQTRNITLLATSRERLGVDGEHVWQVSPLPASGPGAPAVRLFLDRACAADPAAALDPPDAEAVAALCASLDGLPLAIELAAARLPGTTVSELAENLRTGSGCSPPGDGPTAAIVPLRAVVDWSYEQLDSRAAGPVPRAVGIPRQLRYRRRLRDHRRA